MQLATTTSSDDTATTNRPADNTARSPIRLTSAPAPGAVIDRMNANTLTTAPARNAVTPKVLANTGIAGATIKSQRNAEGDRGQYRNLAREAGKPWGAPQRASELAHRLGHRRLSDGCRIRQNSVAHFHKSHGSFDHAPGLGLVAGHRRCRRLSGPAREPPCEPLAARPGSEAGNGLALGSWEHKVFT